MNRRTTTSGTVTTWSRTASWTPWQMVRPETEEQLRDIVADAAQNHRSVKPIGAAHSFSDIAATDGVQVDLGALHGLTAVDPDTRRVRVRAGTPLHALGPALSAHGLALANMGDIDQQTLGGALSTSTHGTGLGFTGYSAMVTALRLLTADGNLRWVDAAHEPELFAAARVSLGALGVITEVELQTVPSFLLHAAERSEPIDRVVAEFVQRSRDNDHHEFYWFPGTDAALTKTNTRLPLASGIDPLPRLRTHVMDELLANRAFDLSCRVGGRWPAAVPALSRLANLLADRREYTDVSHRVFVANRTVPFWETEYALPLERFEEAFEGLRRIHHNLAAAGRAVGFPFEVRTASADDVWLSTAHGRDSVYFAIHQYRSVDPEEYFRAGEELFLSLGGRPHWGKMNRVDAAWAAEAYPRFADVVAQRDRVDPERVFANDYTRRVLGE